MIWKNCQGITNVLWRQLTLFCADGSGVPKRLSPQGSACHDLTTSKRLFQLSLLDGEISLPLLSVSLSRFCLYLPLSFSLTLSFLLSLSVHPSWSLSFLLFLSIPSPYLYLFFPTYSIIYVVFLPLVSLSFSLSLSLSLWSSFSCSLSLSVFLSHLWCNALACAPYEHRHEQRL